VENNELIRIEAHVTLAAAEAAIRAGLAKAEEIGVKIAIVVVDSSSFFVAGVRMDGCRGRADEAAKGKAVFSLGTPKGTADFIENRLQHNEALWRAMASRNDIWPVQGGFPLRYQGRTVDGVGVSGAKHEQDSEVAQAAADHFNQAAERAAAATS
jgi:glc operon protein GlcG